MLFQISLIQTHNMMTESEFNQLVDTTLVAIENAIEDCDADIDYDTVADILTLEFENGSRIIINRQSAQQQLWLAAKSGGFHFNWHEQHWKDNRDGVELWQRLSHLCSEQANEAVDLTPSL